MKFSCIPRTCQAKGYTKNFLTLCGYGKDMHYETFGLCLIYMVAQKHEETSTGRV